MARAAMTLAHAAAAARDIAHHHHMQQFRSYPSLWQLGSTGKRTVETPMRVHRLQVVDDAFSETKTNNAAT